MVSVSFSGGYPPENLGKTYSALTKTYKTKQKTQQKTKQNHCLATRLVCFATFLLRYAMFCYVFATLCYVLLRFAMFSSCPGEGCHTLDFAGFQKMVECVFL